MRFMQQIFLSVVATLALCSSAQAKLACGGGKRLIEAELHAGSAMGEIQKLRIYAVDRRQKLIAVCDDIGVPKSGEIHEVIGIDSNTVGGGKYGFCFGIIRKNKSELYACVKQKRVLAGGRVKLDHWDWRPH